MRERKGFQICYEGEIDIELVARLRRLGAEPNFDKSWLVHLDSSRHAALVLRALRSVIPPDGKMLVAERHLSASRDFLLVRHSVTPGIDYERLRLAMSGLGDPIEIDFESTWVLRSLTTLDTRTIGEAIADLYPDDSLMISGISHDFALHAFGRSQMFVAAGAFDRAQMFQQI